MTPKILELIKRALKLEEKTEDSEWQSIALADGVTAVTTKGLRYRKVGSKVTIEGRVSLTWNGSTNLTIGQVPTGFRPVESVYSFFPLIGARIARGYVNTLGNIIIEWIYNISDGASVTTNMSWMHIHLEYFVD